jgi:hypothetical protein
MSFLTSYLPMEAATGRLSKHRINTTILQDDIPSSLRRKEVLWAPFANRKYPLWDILGERANFQKVALNPKWRGWGFWQVKFVEVDPFSLYLKPCPGMFSFLKVWTYFRDLELLEEGVENANVSGYLGSSWPLTSGNLKINCKKKRYQNKVLAQ